MGGGFGLEVGDRPYTPEAQLKPDPRGGRLRPIVDVVKSASWKEQAGLLDVHACTTRLQPDSARQGCKPVRASILSSCIHGQLNGVGLHTISEHSLL